MTTYLYFWLHPTRKPDSVTAVLAYSVKKKETLIPKEKEGKKIIIGGVNSEWLNLLQSLDLKFTNTQSPQTAAKTAANKRQRKYLPGSYL